MQDTAETLQSALADLTRRVEAFEKAQKQAEVEPRPPDCGWPDYIQELHALGVPIAAEWIEWAQAELARLREGLKVQPEDVADEFNQVVAQDGHGFGESYRAMAREIQRHRALVTK